MMIRATLLLAVSALLQAASGQAPPDASAVARLTLDGVTPFLDGIKDTPGTTVVFGGSTVVDTASLTATYRSTMKGALVDERAVSAALAGRARLGRREEAIACTSVRSCTIPGNDAVVSFAKMEFDGDRGSINAVLTVSYRRNPNLPWSICDYEIQIDVVREDRTAGASPPSWRVARAQTTRVC